jgi:hypothetical protein
VQKSAWKEVRKTDKDLPARGRVRESTIEPAIEDEVGSGCVAKRPQVAHRIAPQEGLGKVPQFPGDGELLSSGMRNGKRLCKLAAVDIAFNDLVKHGICIVVKAFHICAREKEQRVSSASQIEFGSPTVKYSSEIAHGNRGSVTLSMMDKGLRSKKEFCCPIRSSIVGAVMDDGFCSS